VLSEDSVDRPCDENTLRELKTVLPNADFVIEGYVDPQAIRQNLPVDALRQVWQDGAAMNEGEKQFSFTRAAPSKSAPAKNQILISYTFLTKL